MADTSSPRVLNEDAVAQLEEQMQLPKAGNEKLQRKNSTRKKSTTKSPPKPRSSGASQGQSRECYEEEELHGEEVDHEGGPAGGAGPSRECHREELQEGEVHHVEPARGARARAASAVRKKNATRKKSRSNTPDLHVRNRMTEDHQKLQICRVYR